MTTARHDLVLMVRLQRVYDQIAEAIKQLKSVPPEVQELKEANRSRLAELEGLEVRLSALTAEVAEVRKKEQECRLELEHFQHQKGMVTNEREFTAVISEIDFANRALEEASARRGELEATIAAFGDDIEARRNARPEEEAAHREVTSAWEARKEELTQEVHERSAEARALESKLTPSHRSRFLRLLSSKHGTAIAGVVEGSCSLCHFELRPHLQQRVRRCEEIIVCEHCHRILYFAELAAEEAAEEVKS